MRYLVTLTFGFVLFKFGGCDSASGDSPSYAVLKSISGEKNTQQIKPSKTPVQASTFAVKAEVVPATNNSAEIILPVSKTDSSATSMNKNTLHASNEEITAKTGGSLYAGLN